jgi:hypothetical protein
MIMTKKCEKCVPRECFYRKEKRKKNEIKEKTSGDGHWYEL